MESADQFLSQNSQNPSTAHKQNKAIGGLDKSLSIFRPSSFEVGVRAVTKIDFHPLATIQRGKCIEFQIPQSNSLYFALDKTVLRMKVRIRTLANEVKKVTLSLKLQ